MNTDKRQLAVLFPGIGYNFDRPLLHFAREQALQFGYEVAQVPYSGFPPHIRGDREKMKESLDIASRQAVELLQGTEWQAYQHIVFISKSIGTIVAMQYASQYQIRADQILFTPFPETFSFPLSGRAVAFHAQTDPWMDDAATIQAAAAAGVPMYLYPEGNHSLETGDTLQDIRILEDVFGKTEPVLNRRA